MPSEDSLDLTDATGGSAAVVDIAVVRLPRLANFDDFEWLAAEPGVRVRWVASAAALAGADLIVLPGSRARWPISRGCATAAGRRDRSPRRPPAARCWACVVDTRCSRHAARPGRRRIVDRVGAGARAAAGRDALRARQDDGAGVGPGDRRAGSVRGFGRASSPTRTRSTRASRACSTRRSPGRSPSSRALDRRSRIATARPIGRAP